MKKMFLASTCFFLILFSLFSTQNQKNTTESDPLFSLRFANTSLSLTSKSPLFTPYIADNFTLDSSLQQITLLPNSKRPSFLYTVEKTNGITTGFYGYNFDSSYNQDSDTYIYLRSGISITAARIGFGGFSSFPRIELEAFLTGGMRAMFMAFGGTDQLGFDGTYSYGMSGKIGKIISFQIGRKHFSGHFGDEIITRTIRHNNSLDASELDNSLLDYVRQDPLMYAISFQIHNRARIYGELRRGLTGRILKPNYSNNDPIFDSYHALEVQVGSEFSIPIPKIGNLRIACNFLFHENGKFTLVGDDSYDPYKGQYPRYTLMYDPSAPWEMDMTIVIAQELSTSNGQNLRIIGTYHRGRFPLFAFYLHRVSYYSFGISYGF